MVNPFFDEGHMTRRFTLGFAIALSMAATLVAQTKVVTPVADAAKRGDLTGVRALLKTGADASTAHADGMSPLHWAADHSIPVL